MNLKVRFKNPVFWAQIFLAVFTPILAYFGLTAADMNTWQAFGNTLLSAISNPYVCGLVVVSVWQTLNDPTTQGFADSERAMKYEKPVK